VNRILRAPAVQALLLQIAAFPLTLAAVYLAARAGFKPDYFHAALVQGLSAAGLTWWRGLASWWRAIQFAFPLALLGAGQLAIPPGVFLGVFLFLLLLYWSTYRTQVPYYPSGRKVWDAVAEALPQGRAVRVIDIGSGLGGLVLDLQRRRPESRFEGIELAPLPWLASLLRAKLARSPARFIRGDYEQLDFGAYDAVFAYLSPAAMPALWRKAARELQPGSVLFSYEFVIADRPPSRIVTPYREGPKLYRWDF
jgi:SAM-dependent methyltransferase